MVSYTSIGIYLEDIRFLLEGVYMIEFINIYNEKVKTIGNQVAFTDGTKSLTYRELVCN